MPNCSDRNTVYAIENAGLFYPLSWIITAVNVLSVRARNGDCVCVYVFFHSNRFCLNISSGSVKQSIGASVHPVPHLRHWFSFQVTLIFSSANRLAHMSNMLLARERVNILHFGCDWAECLLILLLLRHFCWPYACCIDRLQLLFVVHSWLCVPLRTWSLYPFRLKQLGVPVQFVLGWLGVYFIW